MKTTATSTIGKIFFAGTLALFSVFEDQQACRIFQRHPEYQRVWETKLAPVVEDRIVAEGPAHNGTGA